MLKQIRKFSNGLFTAEHLELFLKKYLEMSQHETVEDYLINLSADQGNELEISFFTQNFICDITLSNGVVYSYKFEISKIQVVTLVESDQKWTLNIFGEKRFDYNVVKPGSHLHLLKYKEAVEARTL